MFFVYATHSSNKIFVDYLAAYKKSKNQFPQVLSQSELRFLMCVPIFFCVEVIFSRIWCFVSYIFTRRIDVYFNKPLKLIITYLTPKTHKVGIKATGGGVRPKNLDFAYFDIC